MQVYGWEHPSFVSGQKMRGIDFFDELLNGL